MSKRIVSMSQMSSLALCSMSIIAAAERRLISAREIANIISCSPYHLVKVLQKLAQGGFIASTRGPNGGFALMREAESISLLDIFSWMEDEHPMRPLPEQEDNWDNKLYRAIFADKCAVLEEELRAYLAGHNIGEFVYLVKAETEAVFRPHG
jgi:Rrf2 family protein